MAERRAIHAGFMVLALLGAGCVGSPPPSEPSVAEGGEPMVLPTGPLEPGAKPNGTTTPTNPNPPGNPGNKTEDLSNESPTTVCSVQWVPNASVAVQPMSVFGTFRTCTALDDCGGCWESTIAVAEDGTLIARVNVGPFAVSDDGGNSWTKHPYPPFPSTMPPGFLVGENIIGVSPTGRLMIATTIHTNVGASGVSTGGNHQAGFHFAASDDFGASWVVNRFIDVESVAGRQVTGIDRPWIAFGPDGETYLTYAGIMTGVYSGLSQSSGATAACDIRLGIAVQRSDDGGVTWTDPVTAVKDGSYCWRFGTLGPPDGYSCICGAGAVNGQIDVDDDGRVYLAAYVSHQQVVCALGNCQVLGDVQPQFIVAVSEDRGSSFSHHVVWGWQEHQYGGYSSSVAVAPDGTVYAAGRTQSGAILVSYSSDNGRTWSTAQQWSASGMVAEFGIRALAGPLGVDVAWYAKEGDGPHRLQVARMGSGGETPQAIDLSPPIKEGHKGIGANTDFAFIAHRPDGRLAAVWSDAALGIVAVVVEDAPA